MEAVFFEHGIFLHGDSFEAAMNGELKNLIRETFGRKDGKCDLILTDLPYFVIDTSWDSRNDGKTLTPRRFSHLCGGMMDTGTIITTAQLPFTTDLITAMNDYPSMRFRHSYIFSKGRKTGARNSRVQPLKSTEDVVVFTLGAITPEDLIKVRKMKPDDFAKFLESFTENPAANGQISPNFLVFGKKETTFIPEVIKREKEVRTKLKVNVSESAGLKSNSLAGKTITNDRYYTSDLIYADFEPEEDPWHGTQKPATLFCIFAGTYSKDGAIIVDPCGGSGVTAKAVFSMRHSRPNTKFVVIEKDRGNFERAVKDYRRWEKVGFTYLSEHEEIKPASERVVETTEETASESTGGFLGQQLSLF